MADNEEAVLKEAKKLSVEDRLAHKHWKARVQVLEDIAAACADAKDPKDAKFREYGEFLCSQLCHVSSPSDCITTGIGTCWCILCPKSV
jgi:hypothetical protein